MEVLSAVSDPDQTYVWTHAGVRKNNAIRTATSERCSGPAKTYGTLPQVGEVSFRDRPLADNQWKSVYPKLIGSMSALTCWKQLVRVASFTSTWLLSNEVM
jgi:hypothetical protein